MCISVAGPALSIVECARNNNNISYCAHLRMGKRLRVETETTAESQFLRLPDLALHYIASHCDARTLEALRATCKQLCVAADDVITTLHISLRRPTSTIWRPLHQWRNLTHVRIDCGRERNIAYNLPDYTAEASLEAPTQRAALQLLAQRTQHPHLHLHLDFFEATRALDWNGLSSLAGSLVSLKLSNVDCYGTSKELPITGDTLKSLTTLTSLELVEVAHHPSMHVDSDFYTAIGALTRLQRLHMESVTGLHAARFQIQPMLLQLIMKPGFDLHVSPSSWWLPVHTEALITDISTTAAVPPPGSAVAHAPGPMYACMQPHATAHAGMPGPSTSQQHQPSGQASTALRHTSTGNGPSHPSLTHTAQHHQGHQHAQQPTAPTPSPSSLLPLHQGLRLELNDTTTIIDPPALERLLALRDVAGLLNSLVAIDIPDVLQLLLQHTAALAEHLDQLEDLSNLVLPADLRRRARSFTLRLKSTNNGISSPGQVGLPGCCKSAHDTSHNLARYMPLN